MSDRLVRLSIAFAVAAVALALGAGCEREARRLQAGKPSAQTAEGPRQGELQQAGKSLSDAETNDLATLNKLLTNLVQWTELKAAEDQDTIARRLAIDKMAKAIYPHWHLGREGEEAKELYVNSLENERRQIDHDLASVATQLQEAQQQKANLERQAAPPQKTTAVAAR